MAAQASPRGCCPKCGAESSLNEIRCWLCGWAPGAADSAVATPPVIIEPTPSRELHPFQFSLGGLLVATTVIAVCLGALRAAPGLGILLIVVLAIGIVPATIRARVVRRHREQGNSSQDGGRQILAYVESFAITAAAITVGLVACGMVAFVAILVGCGGIPALDRKVNNDLASLLLFGSPVVGLLVAGLLFWFAWPRKR